MLRRKGSKENLSLALVPLGSCLDYLLLFNSPKAWWSKTIPVLLSPMILCVYWVCGASFQLRVMWAVVVLIRAFGWAGPSQWLLPVAGRDRGAVGSSAGLLAGRALGLSMWLVLFTASQPGSQRPQRLPGPSQAGFGELGSSREGSMSVLAHLCGLPVGPALSSQCLQTVPA